MNCPKCNAVPIQYDDFIDTEIKVWSCIVCGCFWTKWQLDTAEVLNAKLKEQVAVAESYKKRLDAAESVLSEIKEMSASALDTTYRTSGNKFFIRFITLIAEVLHSEEDE